MLLVARLGEPMLRRLREAGDQSWHVRTVPSLAGLPAAVAAYAPDAVVVDPADAGTVRTDAVLALRANFPNTPVLVYTVVRPETMAAMVPFGRAGVADCVLRDFTDHPVALRRSLHVACSASLEDRVLTVLGEALTAARAPREAAFALTSLFRSPTRVAMVDVVASAADRTSQWLNKWLRRSGLAPARTMMQAAAALRGYRYAQDASLTLPDVAIRLGYPKPRVFADTLSAVTGCTLSEWRGLDPDAAVDRILSRITRPLSVTSRARAHA